MAKVMHVHPLTGFARSSRYETGDLRKIKVCVSLHKVQLYANFPRRVKVCKGNYKFTRSAPKGFVKHKLVVTALRSFTLQWNPALRPPRL